MDTDPANFAQLGAEMTIWQALAPLRQGNELNATIRLHGERPGNVQIWGRVTATTFTTETQALTWIEIADGARVYDSRVREAMMAIAEHASRDETTAEVKQVLTKILRRLHEDVQPLDFDAALAEWKTLLR